MYICVKIRHRTSRFEFGKLYKISRIEPPQTTQIFEREISQVETPTSHLLRCDEQDVDCRPPVHPEEALCRASLAETVEHRGVHPLAIGTDLEKMQI